MSGFTGIPGQTKDGAKAYADALFRAYKAGKLPLQTKSERSRPNLDRWGRWKREAIKGYDRASSEFLHKKSPGEKAVQRLLEDPKALSRMSAYDFRNLKGYLMMHKLGRHGMSLIASMGESAAGLAPDSNKGVAFDIGTLGVGAATKLLKLSKLGKLAMPVAKTRPLQTLRSASKMRKAAKSTHSMNVAIGRPELTGQMLKIQKANEIVSGAMVAKKTMEAVHAGHMTEKSGRIIVNRIADALAETKVRKGPIRTNLRPRPPLPNIASQIRAILNKEGNSTLPQPAQPPKPRRTGRSKHLPPLNTIKGLPEFKDGFVPGPKIGDILKSKQLDRMRRHIPPLRQHKPGVPPPYKHTPGKSFSGERRSPRPKAPSYSSIDPIKIADWSLRYQHRDRPLIHADKPFMSTVDRLKVLETRAIEQRRVHKLMDRFKRSIGKPHPSTYSSGQSNPLRQLGRTLVNPNRARPIVRAPAFR